MLLLVFCQKMEGRLNFRLFVVLWFFFCSFVTIYGLFLVMALFIWYYIMKWKHYSEKKQTADELQRVRGLIECIVQLNSAWNNHTQFLFSFFHVCSHNILSTIQTKCTFIHGYDEIECYPDEAKKNNNSQFAMFMNKKV